MRNMLMDRALGDQADLIMTHPRHQQALRTLIELITDLRRCRQPAEQVEFQGGLLRIVLEVEERRSEIKRVLKRLGRPGGTVPRDAPELGTGLDARELESWQLEDEVFERIWRQYKSIGDALAWRAFGYDRRIIVALSRSDPPGLMFGKAGLTKELELIETTWREERKFVLLHDLTAALRIGDVSIFSDDGSVLLHEIKTNQSRRIPRQDQLLYDTSAVLAAGGTLPSGFTLVPTGVPFRTDLRGLREIIGLAHERDGIQAGVLRPDRAVVAAGMSAAANRYGGGAFAGRIWSELIRCRRRIGLGPSEHGLTLTSWDSVSRSPARPPWAIYPLAPEFAAGLTTDTVLFLSCIHPDAVIDGLANVGVQATWMQPPDGPVDWAKPLLSVAMMQGRSLKHGSMNPEAIAGLMLEFIDLDTWCRQAALAVSGDGGHGESAGVRPWPCFSHENRTWV
jgi:hypothetical protein